MTRALATRPAVAMTALMSCLLAMSVSPTSAAELAVDSSPTTNATATTDPCRSTLTPMGGTPWRASTCGTPSYTNSVIPVRPVLHKSETSKIRTLPGSLLNIEKYTEPVYYSTTSTPLRTVRCTVWGCVGGASAPIRGHEVVAPGSDAQLIIVDTERRLSYEMYRVTKDPDGTVAINSDGTVTVGSLSVVDLDGSGTKTADGKNLNITGAGVSRLFGVIRAHEVRAAATSPSTAIPHALQVSLPTSWNCSRVFREPATKTDGRATTTSCIQEGARVHMNRAFDCSTPPTKMGQAVCFAMRKYGAYVMDNNGSSVMAFFAQHRLTWPTASTDYAAVGVTRDYQSLGLPMTSLRVLRSWNGT